MPWGGIADIYRGRDVLSDRPVVVAGRPLVICCGITEDADGDRANTAVCLDGGGVLGVHRKVHLPGHAEPQPNRNHQHLEKRYFEPGDLGFPVGARRR